MVCRTTQGFNISNSLRKHYVFPSAGFVPFPDTKGYAEYNHTPTQPEPRKNSSWRIDYASFGILYAAVPTTFGLPPNRVDLIIPDQIEWPPSLWDKLDARDSVHLPDVTSLGIASYLCEGLQHWANTLDDFAEVYCKLPFGSSLRLQTLTENPQNLEFSIQQNNTLKEPGVFLSAKELCSLWGLDESKLPPTISYTSLTHQRQISGEAILVLLPDDVVAATNSELTMVFKSSKNTPSKIYHELKVLLFMQPCKTIIGRPRFLVTLPDSRAVSGFLLTYHTGGDLSGVLLERKLAETLTLDLQLSWARNLISSLIHIKDDPAIGFYSDLRMDQLVLPTNSNEIKPAILLDFEQSRNVYNWAPPEIYYLEWLAELGNENHARCDGIPKHILDKYGGILNRYLQSRDCVLTSIPKCYDNPAHGWYWPWVSSTPAERESGMVYMGGKALWCIFEGIGDADIVLGRSTKNDGQIRFPTFLKTPPAIQALIKSCTAGAREWLDEQIPFYRWEGKIFLSGKTGLPSEPKGTFEEIKETIKLFWLREMRKAEKFLEARMRYDEENASEEDLELLHYLRRPTLDKVLTTVEELSEKLSVAKI